MCVALYTYYLPRDLWKKVPMPHVQFVSGILLISAEQKNVKQFCFLLRQLYKIDPWSSLHG